MEILVDDAGGGIDEEYPIEASNFDDVDAIWQKIWDFLSIMIMTLTTITILLMRRKSNFTII